MSPTPRWKIALGHASRSRSFLWKIAIGFLLGGIAIGSVIHHFRPSSSGRLADRVLTALPNLERFEPQDIPFEDPFRVVLQALEHELASPAIAFADFVNALPRLAPLLVVNSADVRAVLQKKFTPQEAELASDFIALHSTDDAVKNSADQRLRTLAGSSAPPRFVFHLLGVHERRQGDPTLAAGYFIQEGRYPDAKDSRRRAVQALIDARQFSKLDRLVRDDTGYADALTAADRLEMAIAQKQWPAILREVPLMQIERQQAGLLTLTLVTGLGWAFFLFHLGETTRFFSPVTMLALGGFILGALSTTPTIYAVIWQEDFLKISDAGNSLQLLAYNVAGIGLREEVCKLLLFLPLLPFLLKRGDERDALLVASFVGLGFAIEENGGYFHGSQGVDGPGRFLTANFLHIVLTGMNGLALFRACASGGRSINEFLTVFPLTVLVHGLYDGLGDVPELAEVGGYLAITLYVVSSLVYFNRADELRENIRMTLSLTGAFVLGLSVVSAVVLIEQISALGPGPGLTRIIPEFLGVGVMILMFTRTFNEGLSD